MISLSDITSFDVIVALIFLLFIIRGGWIGFMRQAAVFAALISSYLLAGSCTSAMMPHLSGFIENPKIVFYINFVLLFILGTISLLVVIKVLRLVMEITMVVWFDRTLGALLGIVKALFITSVLYMIMNSSLVSSSELLKKSQTSTVLAKGSEYVQKMIRDEKLREIFLPKDAPPLDKLLEDINDKIEEVKEMELAPVFEFKGKEEEAGKE